MTTRFIRAYRPSDREALTEICVKTGDSGGNAEGLFRHDSLLGDVYAVPYAEFDPTLTFVVDDGSGRAIGYVLGAIDTDAFYAWFRETWWPSVRDTYAGDEAAERDARVLAYAEGLGATPAEYTADYPAHLHIDLLPETQGGGFGRSLIDTYLAALRERDVTGVHLVAAATNENAIGFYDRLGFTRLPSGAGAAAFGMALN